MRFIKCISMWQPWATAVVTPHPKFPDRGLKEYETRSWNTSYRGLLLIHAAKKWDNKLAATIQQDTFQKYGDVFSIGNMAFGAIIGIVNMERVISSKEFFEAGPNYSKTPLDEYHFGNWDPGRYGWHFKNPLLFDDPIPYKGQQGFFNVPGNLIPDVYILEGIMGKRGRKVSVDELGLFVDIKDGKADVE